MGTDARRGAACVRALCLFVIGLSLTIPARASAEVRKITGLQVMAEGEGVAIAIACPGKAPLALRWYKLRNPARLVFDLQEAALVAGVPSELPVPALAIAQMRAKQYTTEPPVVRLVLDLGKDALMPGWSVRPGKAPGDTVIVLSPPPPRVLAPPQVQVGPKKVEVRLAGAGGLPHQSGYLDDPPRIFIDIAYATTPAKAAQAFSSGPVREVRMAPRPMSDGRPGVRLVAELAEPRLFSETTVGNDLVITLEEAPAAAPVPTGPNPPLERVIVIDPGHGGEDSGAPSATVSEDQVLEKDIALDIGLRLARLLREQGASVTLTREDDIYLPLRDRSDLANRLKAEAFISIHCNSCGAANTLHGTSVYYDHANSAAFAQFVQAELVRELGRSDNGVRNANFAVIRRTECSGILVETAFINYDEERGLLTDPDFRERAALAIMRGVKRFFSQTPSSGAREE